MKAPLVPSTPVYSSPYRQTETTNNTRLYRYLKEVAAELDELSLTSEKAEGVTLPLSETC